LGSVVCSVSFLECSVNGLYDDATTQRATKLHRALASVWSEGFDRQPILNKFQIALALAKREPFTMGQEPYQAARALIDLRNAIAHPKELIESDNQHKKLRARLKGMYALNPQRQHYRDFFPDRCLSADCAFWAVESAANLLLEFKKRMPPRAYGFLTLTTIHKCLEDVQRLRRSGPSPSLS
jgi:hypothetical protein